MSDPNAGMSMEDFGLDSLEDSSGAAPEQPKDVQIPKMDGEGGRTVDMAKLKMVLDVPLKVTVELGRTKLLVNDLLQLGQGSVIELDKMAGEPMEVYVNDKLVGMGEVVVVNEKFGVRLTEVMSGTGFTDVGPREAI